MRQFFGISVILVAAVTGCQKKSPVIPKQLVTAGRARVQCMNRIKDEMKGRAFAMQQTADATLNSEIQAFNAIEPTFAGKAWDFYVKYPESQTIPIDLMLEEVQTVNGASYDFDFELTPVDQMENYFFQLRLDFTQTLPSGNQIEVVYKNRTLTAANASRI